MVEWGGLENRCTFTGTVSSNLTSSAKLQSFWRKNRCPPRRIRGSPRHPTWQPCRMTGRILHCPSHCQKLAIYRYIIMSEKLGKFDLIFIAGAPGTGKSTIANGLQKKFRSPFFEFGWIPEFRKKDGEEISYIEEELIAFENLVLVLKNYIKHGFKNIIVTDLEDKRILELNSHFSKNNYLLFTLTLSDQELLKSRILDEERSSGYRDWQDGIDINKRILKRPLLPHEVRIETIQKTPQTIVEEIYNYLK